MYLISINRILLVQEARRSKEGRKCEFCGLEGRRGLWRWGRFVGASLENLDTLLEVGDILGDARP